MLIFFERGTSGSEEPEGSSGITKEGHFLRQQKKGGGKIGGYFIFYTEGGCTVDNNETDEPGCTKRGGSRHKDETQPSIMDEEKPKAGTSDSSTRENEGIYPTVFPRLTTQCTSG
jgi:hypothetical protein